jgi:hypothetical protein
MKIRHTRIYSYLVCVYMCVFVCVVCCVVLCSVVLCCFVLCCVVLCCLYSNLSKVRAVTENQLKIACFYRDVRTVAEETVDHRAWDTSRSCSSVATLVFECSMNVATKTRANKLRHMLAN